MNEFFFFSYIVNYNVIVTKHAASFSDNILEHFYKENSFYNFNFLDGFKIAVGKRDLPTA